MATTKKRKKKEDESFFSEQLQYRILTILAAFLLIVSCLKLGIVGVYMDYVFVYFFGNFAGIVYGLLLIACGYFFVNLKFPKFASPEAVGVYLILLAMLTLASIPSDHAIKGTDVINLFFSQDTIIRGGLIGALIYGCFSMLFDYIGSLIASGLLIAVGLALLGGRIYLRHRKKVDQFKNKQVKHYQQMIQTTKERKKEKKKSPFFPEKVFADKKIPKPLMNDEEEEPLEIIRVSQIPEPIEAPVAKETIVPEQKKTEPPVIHNGSTTTKSLDHYRYPPLSLLKGAANKRNNKMASQNATDNASKLIVVLKQFGVNASVKNIFIGPSVTKYELTLETGTRVNKILQLQDDIKMALAAKDIRIEAPIPGKSAVGVEIPNLESNTVTFREVFTDIPQKYNDSKLLVPLGKDVTGNSIYAELNKMPHLLIAGATGSGKSVCVNAIICSILMRARPDEVKLLLVDPKKVELTNYNGIAHLLAPVVTDPKKAAVALRMIVEEMERRYDLFARHNVRNIAGYNAFAKEKNNQLKEDEEKTEILPFIVVILDEVADLMMVASKEVEDCIMRISQMARAAGIHLIVATQRPSTDVITGVIKANIPSRIAFAVSSSIDSRTILDTTGAEKLLGKGDMLFSPMGVSHPTRVQGAFVSDEEVSNIVYHVTKQMTAEYDEKYTNLKVAVNNGSSYDDQEDEEYEMAREFVISAQKASASLLQRQFRIGYNKAARLIDQLENDGVIGPQIGSKPREVLIRGYQEEE
ncbi:MAG: DNA translocase FtsK [Beduini sp.]|uniref:FtsK/SpoIIIE family DNA translocase n=1 Tax=Beduini sp. TaxID=1922300 RepID=UPI0039A15070